MPRTFRRQGKNGFSKRAALDAQDLAIVLLQCRGAIPVAYAATLQHPTGLRERGSRIGLSLLGPDVLPRSPNHLQHSSTREYTK
jgi:hypothetical protein